MPTGLSNGELIAEVKRLAGCEREATASLVVHLAEFDARRLHLGAGFATLFSYCTEVLHLSEHDTYNRIEGARAGRRFPVIFDKLRDASVTLATVRLLAPYLTSDNHQELLAASAHRSKREVEELLARHAPRPEVASLVRKLPAPSFPASVPPPTAAPVAPGPPPSPSPGPAPSPASAASVTRSQWIEPLAPDRYVIRFTASAETRDKLRLAQDLLRHAIPNGDTAQVVDRALTALLDDLARKKFAATERPREGRVASLSSRHIPAPVKRAVWLRDRGRCAFVADSGRRCGALGFLEFHHVTPYAEGGPATTSNIQLRCRAHNAYEAELYYGPAAPCEGRLGEV